VSYPFDETFATGIPVGFGAAGGAGGVTATWNAPAQAVDLVCSQAQNFWKITAADQSSDFWFEIDVEVTAAAYTPPHFGFWFWDGVGAYEGQRVVVYTSGWVHSNWTSGGTEYDASGTTTPALWAVVGARKTLRIDVQKSPEGDWWNVRLSMDGVPVLQLSKRYYTTLLPCVFGYGITLRLHRAAGGTPSALGAAPLLNRHGLRSLVGRRRLVPEFVGATTLTHRGLPRLLARRLLAPEHAASPRPNSRGLRLLAGNRNHYYQGNGRITGTVKEKGSPLDLPVSRRVLLLDERTHIVVRETWSDAVTGEYTFVHLNLEVPYLVLAHDYKHNYRAVIADNLAAEAMP